MAQAWQPRGLTEVKSTSTLVERGQEFTKGRFTTTMLGELCEVAPNADVGGKDNREKKNLHN